LREPRDERDVIVFSTTFGRNEEGRFYRLFGPVGAAGGERRLNVAVTRAKRQVVVVGSMPIQEIGTALRGSANPGTGLTPADYLQLYLAYARAVSEADAEQAKALLLRVKPRANVEPVGKGTDSPFEDEVLQAVRNLSYEADCQVGDSGFLIDLAVRHPEPGRGYILGLECDGAAFHSEYSARIRDVWRQEILEARGWKIHRIWSTRWWYHRAEEIQRLGRVLEEARQLAGDS
jgi:restriction endonuclease-like protein/AAA domain-containing protein